SVPRTPTRAPRTGRFGSAPAPSLLGLLEDVAERQLHRARAVLLPQQPAEVRVGQVRRGVRELGAVEGVVQLEPRLQPLAACDAEALVEAEVHVPHAVAVDVVAADDVAAEVLHR